MAIMAGMLPGVESARRRRLWQGGRTGLAELDAAAASGAKRATSSCSLHTNGHVAKETCSMQRKMVQYEWTLESNAREAKERLDQKLRSQREPAIRRHHSMGSMRPSRGHVTNAGKGGGGGGMAVVGMMGLQREVFTAKGARRRFRWSRLRWEAAEQAECAVCLEEFAAGHVLAHLPCGHRFHWGCAVPWVQARSRCPVCRAAVASCGGGGGGSAFTASSFGGIGTEDMAPQDTARQ